MGHGHGQQAVKPLNFFVVRIVVAQTDRSIAEQRHEFFPTPGWVVDVLLAALSLPGGAWLDPCAGHGAIPTQINAIRSDVDWTMIDINPECDDALSALPGMCCIGDFLSLTVECHYRVAFFNSPFSLTLEFVQRALQIADWVVSLQRLDWCNANARVVAWLRTNMPDIWLLYPRPSFLHGSTDSHNYAWFVWPPTGRERSSANVAMLPPKNYRQLALTEE